MPPPPSRRSVPRPALAARSVARPVAARPVSPSTYRRRQALAAGAVAALSAVASVVLGALGGGSLTAPERPLPVVAGQVYEVQPGDTFWAIARSLDPDGDPRPLVDRLVADHGGAVAGGRASRSGSRPGAEPRPGRRRVASVLVRCPGCAHLDDRVIDSRQADDGAAIRRRRECLACGRRFTTFERLEEAPLIVLKRSGSRQPFARSKLVAGMRAAAKNRPVGDDQLEAVAAEIEEQARLRGPEVTSAEVGRMVLDRLRRLDEVAYLRFASVYKEFEEPGDFQRELGLLTEPDPAPPDSTGPAS